MKKEFFLFAAAFIPAVAFLNGANAQSSVSTLQNGADTAIIAMNEKDISKYKMPFKNSPASDNSSTVSGNNTADVKNINKRAIKNFNNEYSKAVPVNWYTLSNGLVAFCKVDGVRNRVFYNKNGNWLHSILDYDEKKMPKDVRAMVKRTYYDFSIEGVNEVHVDNKIIYLVYIKDEATSKTLRICNDEMDVIADFTNSD